MISIPRAITPSPGNQITAAIVASNVMTVTVDSASDSIQTVSANASTTPAMSDIRDRLPYHMSLP